MDIPSCFMLEPNRVWRTYSGGAVLDALAGAADPRDGHFPEDWLLSSTRAVNIGREEFRDEGLSQLTSGGRTAPISVWSAADPVAFWGESHWRRFGDNAGFLLKYLDSAIRLHLQCHPTAEFSRRFLGSESGKTEGYIILGVRPECEGYIYLGFQRPPDPGDFRRAVLEQNSAALLSYFDRIPVRPGEVFYVPGGLPHAIGEGVFMIEMMEPTDFAVRVEFERGGYVLPEAARFMGRDVDFALSMFDFSAYPAEELKRRFFIVPRPLPIRGEAERFSLFDERYTRCFRAEEIRIDGEAEVGHDGLRVLIAVSGQVELEVGNGKFTLKPFDRVLIPARTETLRLASRGPARLYVARPPAAE